MSGDRGEAECPHSHAADSMRFRSGISTVIASVQGGMTLYLGGWVSSWVRAVTTLRVGEGVDHQLAPGEGGVDGEVRVAGL
jgi:hypothetical protein